jgi:hypothetical protein
MNCEIFLIEKEGIVRNVDEHSTAAINVMHTHPAIREPHCTKSGQGNLGRSRAEKPTDTPQSIF